MKPLVTIVTPSYNQGRFIEETIESVLSQDYPYVEYIVMDGGSSDDTLQILKKYEGRLIWQSGPDKGQADAINKGFQRAQGEIWAYLNSDDLYLPGAIREAVAYLEAHADVAMVYGEGYHVEIDGEILERYYTEPFDFQRLAEICFICQPATFFRAEAVRQVGFLNSSLDYCMDYDLWIRLAKSFRIGYYNQYWAKSRLHEDTKTMGSALAVHREILHCVKGHYGKVPARWIWPFAHFAANHYLSSRTPSRNRLHACLVCFMFLQKYIRLNHRFPYRELRNRLHHWLLS